MLQHYAGLLHTLTDLQFDDAQLLDQASMPVFQVGLIKQLCVIKLQVSECVQQASTMLQACERSCKTKCIRCSHTSHERSACAEPGGGQQLESRGYEKAVSGELALVPPLLGSSQRLLNKSHYEVYYEVKLARILQSDEDPF